ncbi:hypothetical protein KCP69_03895 [Salmonella enterica subsp. enterica]|nr:hypothetical protein KCP69_03895 [Salmonella enterica subsp. enterica]
MVALYALTASATTSLLASSPEICASAACQAFSVIRPPTPAPADLHHYGNAPPRSL